MHIVINGRFLSQATTGVQRYAREVVDTFDHHAADWPDTTFELLAPSDVAELPTFKNIEARRVGRLSGHLWEQLELPLHARGDVLFCPGNTAPLISLARRIDVVVTVHDLSYRYFPEAYSRSFRLVYNLLMPFILRFAARIITVSHAEQTQMLRVYPAIAERLFVVPNGGMPSRILDARPDVTIFGDAEPGDTRSGHAKSGDVSGARPGRPYALYVGSFSKRKNFDALLSVATRLVTERPDFDFVFVGDRGKIFKDHPPRQGEAASRIRFAGQVDSLEALVRYYRDATVFVFPSLYESSALPPVEAMACGCPVVVSEIPAHKERCETSAIFCDPHDVEAIFEAVIRVVDDPRLAENLRQAGYVRAREFTWEKCAAKTMAIIRSIPLDGRVPTRAFAGERGKLVR